MDISYLLIGFTVAFSIWTFNNPDAHLKCRHWPYAEYHDGEYYRWLTSGFIHGDQMHLLFNMVTLLFFGPAVEHEFMVQFPEIGRLLFVVFYLMSIVASSQATYFHYRDVQSFSSVGASGGVSAVLFASILMIPGMEIRPMLFPLGIPGFIYAVFYLWYSTQAARRGNDNIDHVAHIFGSIFGFLFPLVLKPMLFLGFLEGMVHWFRSLGT
ncbi:MAG: rhomboid family intramembrane serine protease [Saprospiraceae bacterium]|nr:rhomboid family intramembrane serine protease [Saprospiraceae bacterium]